MIISINQLIIKNLLVGDQTTHLLKREYTYMDTSCTLGRRALQRLDLLLLVVEALDYNGGEAMNTESNDLGLKSIFTTRVELWKVRCHNPLRRTTRRGQLQNKETEALIYLLCSMARRVYPIIHQLLSSKEPDEVAKKRWELLDERLKSLIEERMNPRRGAVQKILNQDILTPHNKFLVRTLALIAGPGGSDRLRASLMDPEIN